MRITFIKLKNYVGIYNGMGLDEISIDLTNSKHHITVITGINGCGKSTLLKAMTILPDNTDAYIPGKDAMKVLDVVDGNNTYNIKIVSSCSSNGSRSTKAFITKNGTELNSNGNISSYKDVVYQEFELDSNFITLSRLSSDDRGLADKSPAERKKFMSFIVDSLEVYNGIYKNLNKKCNIFKSYINNLSTKIKNAGDEGYLMNQLEGFEENKRRINSEVTQLTKELGSYTSLVESTDPNGKLQEKYTEAEGRYNSASDKYNEVSLTYTKMTGEYLEENEYLEDPQALIDKYENLRDEYREGLREFESKRTTLIKEREDLSSKIESTKFQMNEVGKEVNPDLKRYISALEEKVRLEKEAVLSEGIDDPDNTTVDEVESIYQSVRRALALIDEFRQDTDDEIIQVALNYKPSMIKDQNDMISHTKDRIADVTNMIREYSEKIDTLSILKNRPKGCTIDDCYFIKKAYEVSKTGDINYYQKELDKLGEELSLLNSDLMAKTEYLDVIMTASVKNAVYVQIILEMENNKTMLLKNKISNSLYEDWLEIFKKNESFNYFKDALQVIANAVNDMTLYKKDTKELSDLRTEYLKQQNAELRLEELRKNLDSYTESINKNIEELKVTKSCIERRSDIIDNINTKLNNLYEIRSLEIKCSEYKEVFDKAYKELSDIKEQSVNCIKAFEQISMIDRRLDQLYDQLKPIEDSITDIKSKLTLIESYQTEYKMYSDKFNTANILKKHSSPTTGIQTLFMSLYMGKTLELANKVLSMIFGGQYILCPYVINANEFRIPFIGQGMTVDDISHGSTSQVCMMGMVMNLVLKYQASPKYNITSLDEIDGGLDTRNRLEFIDVLYKLIDILEIDQLFIISHSLEIELNNVDVIKLKSYDDFGETITEGNILYDFNALEH